MLQKVIQKLREVQLEEGANIEQQTVTIIEKRPGLKQIRETNSQGHVYGKVSSSVPNEQLEQLLKQFIQNDMEVDLKKELAPGTKFKDYGYINNVLDNSSTTLKHQPEEIELIYFWTKWCPPSHRAINKAIQFISRIEEENKKFIKTIAINLDANKFDAIKVIQKNSWNQITHLTLFGFNKEHPLLQDMKLITVPFLCVVNKFGSIEYIGEPQEFKLQTVLSRLIQQESDEVKNDQIGQVQLQKSKDKQKEIDLFLDSISKSRVQDQFKDVEIFCYRILTTTTYNKKTGSIRKIQIDAHVSDQNSSNLQKAQKFFKAPQHVKIRVEEANYTKVPLIKEPKCWKCNINLEYPFYWLRWQEGEKFGCRKCVEAPSTVQGHNFAYENNSVLLLKQWKYISAQQMGNNNQPANIADIKQGHKYTCNCCRKGGEKEVPIRYLCLGCRAGPNFRGDYCDICQQCFEKIVAENEQTVKPLYKEGHVNAHPILRILYNPKGYYDF